MAPQMDVIALPFRIFTFENRPVRSLVGPSEG